MSGKNLSRFANCASLFIEGSEVLLATSLKARTLGLAYLDYSHARPLLIPGCRSVHTFAMRFTLDLVFLTWPPTFEQTATVIATTSALRPNRLATCLRAKAVLEIPSGSDLSLRGVNFGRSQLIEIDGGSNYERNRSEDDSDR